MNCLYMWNGIEVPVTFFVTGTSPAVCVNAMRWLKKEKKWLIIMPELNEGQVKECV